MATLAPLHLRLRNTSVNYAPGFIEDRQVPRLFPAHGEFAIANFVDVGGSVVFWLSVARELVSCNHNSVLRPKSLYRFLSPRRLITLDCFLSRSDPQCAFPPLLQRSEGRGARDTNESIIFESRS